jgi:hypothetical protein
VTLYLGDVKPGSAQAFEYTLRPKYPIKAKATEAPEKADLSSALAAVAYEYCTPASRAASPQLPGISGRTSGPLAEP